MILRRVNRIAGPINLNSVSGFVLDTHGRFGEACPLFLKSGALPPEYGLFVTEQRAIAAKQCMKRAPNSRATADRVILL